MSRCVEQDDRLPIYCFLVITWHERASPTIKGYNLLRCSVRLPQNWSTRPRPALRLDYQIKSAMLGGCGAPVPIRSAENNVMSDDHHNKGGVGGGMITCSSGISWFTSDSRPSFSSLDISPAPSATLPPSAHSRSPSPNSIPITPDRTVISRYSRGIIALRETSRDLEFSGNWRLYDSKLRNWWRDIYGGKQQIQDRSLRR